MDPSYLLAINAGSSSLKFALFELGSELESVYRGRFERIGSESATLTASGTLGEPVDGLRVEGGSHAACMDRLVGLLETAVGLASIAGIGHRVVHGGRRRQTALRVTADLLAELRRLRSFAPRHLPVELQLIEDFLSIRPGAPQVACFDTAFHRDLPQVARLLPIPRGYGERGVERYGFHGLSYAYLLEELERVAGAGAARGRVVLAHLGSGASMAAVRGGKSIDTTMAFTPASGLVMSTRSGDLDPGLVAYLAETEGMTVDGFHDMVNGRSGLLGISGTSGDVRDLLVREPADPRAAEALAVFCYQARKWVGALAAALGGLDTLVFSGGIGEGSPPIRSRICEGLGFLGLELGAERNHAGAPLISSDSSRVAVRVLRTDEERFIARWTLRLVNDSGGRQEA